MRWFVKRRTRQPVGPRKNQWGEARSGQGMSQRAGAGRVRAAAQWRTLLCRGRLAAGAVLIGWAFVMGVRHSGPALQRLLEIKTVTVQGLHHIDQREVIDLVGLKPGTALHQIVTTRIQEQVEAHPWVKEAVVSRVPFHELRISVIERKPAAVIRAGSETFLSDETGQVLASLGQADDDTLPMVTGLDASTLLRGDERVRRVIASGIELAKLVGHTYEGRLEVNVEHPSNPVASVRGVQFQFGQESVSDQWERFRRVKPALKTLNFDGRGSGAHEVDLRYENRIIVRERG